MNTETRIVGVKLSSWQTPQHTGHLIDTLRAFGAIGIALHAGAGHEAARDPSV